MKAIIWGACGSLPTPITPSETRKKLRDLLWSARYQSFKQPSDVDSYLESLPRCAYGHYRGNTSCVEIITNEDAVILCDAGSGLRNYAQSISDTATPRTYHIFISHLHWDHIQGIPFFCPAYIPGNHIIFYGLHATMESAIRQQMNPPNFPVPFEAMQAKIEFKQLFEGRPQEVGGVTVRNIRQQHPGDSWGYRFEEGDQAIVYSSDSEHGEEYKSEGYPFVHFFKHANILIFDGQYSPEDATHAKRNWGHSNYITAIELAARAKVKQLCLFHHEPSHSDAKIENLLSRAVNHHKEFQVQQGNSANPSYPNSLSLAYDGLVLEA